MPFTAICRWSAAASLLAVLAGAPPAGAQDAATVKVGNQTKKTSGTVTKLENGDVACYLTLKDERGAAFSELGDFSLCGQKPSLLGKRVTLTYTLQKVMSDECQGNPDCKKTRTVALVSGAKIIDAKGPAGASAPQTSFCTAQETVVFACRTGAKLVSVCASKDAASNRGYLQYRFGKPDSSGPLEITLPESRTLPSKAASGDTLAFSGGGGAWLRFRKGEYAYSVYTGIGKWGPKGETREKQGLLVERGGKPVANLKCSGALSSELGPDLFGKLGVRANKEDFDMPD